MESHFRLHFHPEKKSPLDATVEEALHPELPGPLLGEAAARTIEDLYI